MSSNPLAYGAYRRLACANFVATSSLWVQRIAVAFFMWGLTGSAFWTAVVLAAQFVPSAFLGPLFGVLIDRIRLRTGVHLAFAISASGYLVMLGAFVAGVAQPWIYALAALWSGVGVALYSPVRLVLPTVIVPKAALPGAIAISATSFNVTRVIGPFLGAASITAFGVAMTLGVALVGYCSFWLITLTLRFRPRDPLRHDDAQRARGFVAQLREGVSYVWTQPALRAYMTVAVLSSVSIRAAAELAPVINGLRFGGAAGTLSLLTLTPALGAIAAGVTLGLVRRHSTWIERTMVASLIVGPLSTLALAVAPGLGAVLLALLVNGLTGSLAAIGSQTMLQVTLDDRLRARVMSLWASFALGSIAVASALYGALADVIGLTISLGGVAVLGFALAVFAAITFGRSAAFGSALARGPSK